MNDRPAFTSYPLDRADEIRGDAARLAELRASSRARTLPFWRLKPLVADAAAGGVQSSYLGGGRPGDQREDVFLGLDREKRAVFALALPPDDDPGLSDPNPSARFMELREAASIMDASEASILCTARSLLAWHETHRFCSRCGAPSGIAHGGWRRVCTRCLEEHYPRVNPVVIMVIARGDKILLGRQPSWPERAYSCLAGFVEPGETPEQAARREAFEESGVVLGDVTYLMAQPWPFPSQLMLGMHAEALTDEIRIDASELADARWFSRAEVVDMMAGRSAVARTPYPIAVAHHLIKWWLEKG